jgi:hypothetical protein
MRAPVYALAALLLAPALLAQGRTDYSFKRDLAAGRRFDLANIIGDVDVTGTSGRTVEVTAVMKAGRHGDPRDVTVETVDLDDGVALCVRYPQSGRHRSSSRSSDDDKPRSPCDTGDWSGNGERNDTEVHFTVRVPAGLKLHIGTVSGDVIAEKLEGDIEITSVSGDVRLTGGAGPSISLETVSGSVEILDGRAPEVYGHTISGEVTFRGPILAKGSYEFATTSGDIILSLPSQPDARMSAATFSGRFSSDFPATTNASRRNRHRYEATWGSGSASLELESLSGDIRITTSSH